METSFILDNKSKQLGLQLKQRFEHSSDVQLKVSGVLNTVTSEGQFFSKLNKFLRLGKLPQYTSLDIYRPDTRLRLGIGAKALSVTDDVFFSVNAKKKFSLHKSQEVVRGRPLLNSYTQLVAGVTYDCNLRNQVWAGQADAKLSHAMFSFTKDQDIRVTVGLKAPISPVTGVGNPEPYLRVQENCWGVVVDKHGGWRVTYDL